MLVCEYVCVFVEMGCVFVGRRMCVCVCLLVLMLVCLCVCEGMRWPSILPVTKQTDSRGNGERNSQSRWVDKEQFFSLSVNMPMACLEFDL